MKLLEKLGLVAVANAHAMADSFINMNSIPVIKEEVRRLENSRTALNVQVAAANGRVKMANQDIVQMQSSIKKMQDGIDILLGDADDTNDADALTLQVQADAIKQQLAARQDEMASLQQTATMLQSSYDKLDSKVREYTSRIGELERLDREAKVKGQAADALEAVGKLTGVDTSSSVDNYAEQVRERAATADARLAQQFSAVSSDPAESVAMADAKAALAKRKAEIAAAKTSAAA